MKLNINNIELPACTETLMDYMNSNYPMKAITKYIIELRKQLRKDMLESKSEEERKNLYLRYWGTVLDVYTIECDMSENVRYLKDLNIDGLDITSFYNFLKRTFVLNNMEIAGIYVKEVPWDKPDYMDFSGNNSTCNEYIDTWWPLIMIELKEDPREVLKDVHFVNVTNNTKITEVDWDREKEAKGYHIMRRIGECPAISTDISGLNIQYIYIKDNPNEKTKTVFLFGIPQYSKLKKTEIRVSPIVIKVRE